jgi:hypothetical protein
MAWMKWRDVSAVTQDREVVFWGRSEDWIPKCTPHVNAAYIIDSDESFYGEKYLGLSICPSVKLEKSDQKPFVIITTGDFSNVGSTLDDIGYVSGLDYCYCPEYSDFQSLVSLREKTFKVIFTSGDYKTGKATRVSHNGGGLYHAEFSVLNSDIHKVADGQYREIVRYDGGYAAVEYTQCRIDMFSDDLELVNSIPLPRSHFCGLAWSQAYGKFYVANASTDIVHIFDVEGNDAGEINFGSKSDNEGNSRYHINDLDLFGDSLFVSYFSESGFWKYDVFDGGVAAFDLETLDKSTLYQGLWQPHTPRVIRGKLHILDSFRGLLYNRPGVPLAEFPGFIRGVDFRDGYYIVGQSEDMYMSRKSGLSNNIMNNAGIWLFDEDSKGSRFYDCAGICNIHSVLFL